LSSEHGERLAAILLADVASSCRLIAIDEEGTLAQLKALIKTLLDPKITDHRGRIVKNTGDGIQFFMAWRAFDLSQWRAASEGTSFSKWGKQVMEKIHEADASDNRCYCSLDVRVCGAALLRLV
jgi:class 3 adenylate cyclase